MQDCVAGNSSVACPALSTVATVGSEAVAMASISAAATLAILATLALHSCSAQPPVGCAILRRVRAVFLAVDMFSRSHAVPDGSAVVKQSTTFGGTCTLLGAITIASLGAALVARRSFDNILQTQSITVADSSLLLDMTAITPATTADQHAQRSGLEIQLVVEGNTGDCDHPLRWTAAGLQHGSFTLSSASCGSTARHVFSCADCLFGPGSSLVLTMRWSCQSVLISAASVAVDGSVTRVAVASQHAATDFLSTFAWSVSPFLQVQRDEYTSSTPVTTRGYQLVAGAVTTTNLVSGVEGGYRVILPDVSPVTVALDLSPQATYARVLLTEKVSVAQLFANIAGLTSLMTVFSFMFTRLEGLSASSLCAGRRKPAMKLTAVPAMGSLVPDEIVEAANPVGAVRSVRRMRVECAPEPASDVFAFAAQRLRGPDGGPPAAFAPTAPHSSTA